MAPARRGVRSWSAMCARGARALRPRHLPPQPALRPCPVPRLPASLTPSVHVLDYCLPLTSFSFFFPAPPLPRILFPKADARRSKWEKGLSLSRTLPLPGGGGGGCCLPHLLPALRSSSQSCERWEAQAACGDPGFSAHAQVPRCPAGAEPGSVAAPRASCAWRAMGQGCRSGGLAFVRRLTRAAQPHASPFVPPCFRGRLVGQLLFFVGLF